MKRPDGRAGAGPGEDTRPSIFIVAGEASGDWAGGLLARALRERAGVSLRGIGGRRMRAAGVELLADSSDWGAIGVLEAASKIPRVWMTLRRTRAHLAEAPPSALVLIDCGAFNMPLARAARRMGLPTLYYLPPGSWSRRARNSELRDLVDVVATPFLWSRELLAGGRAEVEWVGHPVVEAARPKLTPEEARGRYGLDRSRPVVALAPGSREQEMHYLLPVLAGAAKRLLEDRNGAQFVVPVAATVDGNRVRDALNEVGAEPKLLDGMEYDALQLAGAAAVCSGTATLELACLGVPMVVVYRASRATTLQYRLFRGMIGRQQWAAMPNIIAGREVVRELLGSAATAEAVAVEVGGLLGDRERRRRMREGLAEVVSSLGLPGASARTATLVLEMIGLQEGAGVQS